MVAAAEKKVARFNSFKGEIDTDLAKALEIVESISRKIRENTLSKQNKDGILTCKEENYLKCLQINYREFEILLRTDEAIWNENLEIKKKEAEEVKENL